MTNKPEDIYERITKEDFGIIKELSNRIQSDAYVPLAEHLVGVFSGMQKLSPLVVWAVKTEVQSKKQCNLVFREDSLSKAIVNRLLFDTIGIKYLSLLLKPMIAKIKEFDRPLEITPHKVEEAEAKENLNKLLEAISIFVTTFQESELSCPLIIRKLFFNLNIFVIEQFKDEESTANPFSLHFFFFQYICLAMISPDKYNIVDSDTLTDSIRVGLLNASKLLKDLGQTTRDGENSSSTIAEYQRRRVHYYWPVSTH